MTESARPRKRFVRKPAMTRKEAARLRVMLKIERDLRAQGYARVAGADEAGRGPFAGPVCAAVVVFPPETRIAGVNDSKVLSQARREMLYDAILASASAVGVGLASAEEIDEINILRATKLAMRRALDRIPEPPDYLLLDALTLDDCPIPQQGLVRGDSRCFCIAAASIVAKVTRDRLMLRYHDEYPHYGFDQNKGYGTQAHVDAILEHGPCGLHRRSFFDPGFLAPQPTNSILFSELMALVRAAGNAAEMEKVRQSIGRVRSLLPRTELHALQHAAAGRVRELKTQSA